jgi:Fic family protein
MPNLTTQSLVEYLNDRPGGVSSGEIESHFDVSRSTLIRRLKEAMRAGTITVTGKGPATRYFSADPLSALKAYFAKAHTERVVAPYREERLAPSPGLSDEATLKFKDIARHRLGKRELGKFLIDFACASSVLEGGTYSLLDTQALIEYGEKSPGKPLEDAFLVLNHKEAFEYLHDNMRLDSIYRVHDLLTSDHDLPELAESRHFLPANERGVVRDGAEVDIALSTYLPPFRPGTGYMAKALQRVLETADSIQDPVQAAFYLLTRIPYLQPFKDGNKRTSRAICNVPLIRAGLPPISFVDFGKQDYIVSLLAFYELGDTRLAERCLVEAYTKSIARLGSPKP